METRKHQLIEHSRMFELYSDVADTCWNLVARWQPFEKATLGRQLVRCADSVGANISEGAARYGLADGIHFFVIARGSARELEYWLRLCKRRGVIDEQQVDDLLGAVAEAGRLLNGLISYRRENKPGGVVRERIAEYHAEEQHLEDGEHSGLSTQHLEDDEDLALSTQHLDMPEDLALSTQHLKFMEELL